MRDPLLDGASSYLVAYRNAGEAGRKTAGELAEADEIVTGLVAWCRLLMHDTNVIVDWEEGQELSDLLALPSNQLPFPAFDRIADANRRSVLREVFEGLLENRGRRDTNVMAWLLGEAFAKALVECLAHSKEIRVCPISGFQNLASSHDVTHFAFEERLQSLLRDHPSAFAAIVSDLEGYIETIVRDPGIGTYSRERETFNRTIELWRSNPSTEELWRTSGHWVPLHYRILDLVSCIAPVDRAEVLKCLDRLDFPHPIRQVLEDKSVLHDREEIAAMLKDAPSCSNDGRSWNHRLTALLVVETVEAHCHGLWRAASKAQDDSNADAKIMQQTEKTLSSWLHQIGAVVMARRDGRFLGSQWLLRKVADERMERARGRYVEDRGTKELRQEQVIEWIALGLSRAGLQGRDIEGLVDFPESSSGRNGSPVTTAQSDEGSHLPRLGALFMSVLLDLIFGGYSSTGVGKFLEQCDSLLALRDPAFEVEGILTTDSRGLPANCSGYLYANANRPAERWQQSWNLLVEQRRRAQHWHETKDGDALAPSLFLLAAGTAAIEWLTSFRDRNPNEEKELWRAVFDGARDCWLTVLMAPFSGQTEAHVGRLFALHPRVFEGPPIGNGILRQPDESVVNESYSERLADDLSSLGGNDLMLVVCLLNAHHNGASLATMSEVLRCHEGHVDNVLKQFEKWQRVERSARQRSDLVAKVVRLRADIAHFENA